MAGEIGHVDMCTATCPILAHRIIHVDANGGYDHGEWYAADISAVAAAARVTYPTMIHAVETRYVNLADVIDMPRGQPHPGTRDTRFPARGWTAAPASPGRVSEACTPGIAHTSQ